MRLLALLVLLVVLGPVPPAQADEWRWPLDGPAAVSRPFAAPAHRYAAGHRGADLPSAPGAPVRSAGGGLVSYAGLVAGRGVVVVVHGPLRTTYEPVSALVDVGSPVAAGEVIGLLEPGHAGCPALACLHWGLRRGEDYLDPVRLVRPGPVRLLPLEGPAPVAFGGAGAALGSVERPVGSGGGGGPDGSGAGRGAEGGGAEGGGGGGGPVLTPAQVRTRPAAAQPYAGLAGAASVTLLGAAAIGAVRRRRG